MAAASIVVGDNWEVTVYKYENLTIGSMNIMHVLSEDGNGNGSIGWENRTETLPWQGYFRHMPDDTVEFAFDCHACGHLKSAKLYKVDHCVWEGPDYACRAIRLMRLSKLKYCTESKRWKAVSTCSMYSLPIEDFTVV